MANPLTGNFDAVVQIAMRQINGLLARLHENGAVEDSPLKLMHSTSVRVGEGFQTHPDFGDLSDWVLEVQRARPGRGLRDLSAQLSATSPPGVAKFLTDAIADLGKRPVLEIPPNVIRGLARIQVSSVKLSTPPGSTSEVTVHAGVRAHYYPDAGTTSLPPPIHGDVEVVFEIHIVPPSGGAEIGILMAPAPGFLGDALFGSSGKLVVRPSSDDSKIRFTAAPGSGLSAVEESRISAEMRKVVRHGIELLPVDLPQGFPFHSFKGVGTGPQQALALPIVFPGTAPPANGFQGLTQPFTGSSGFGFAVRKEHVIGLIDIEKIRSEINSRTFRKYGANYRLNCTVGPNLTFHAGHIEVSGRVDARTSAWWAPNGFVSFKQRLGLHLSVPSQTIRLRRLGAPDVDESWFLSHDWAVDTVRTEMVNAVEANQESVRSVFDGAKAKLVGGLKEFDPSASAQFTEVEITEDGIIIRGDIGGGGRNAPVVDIADTHQNTAFTAFKSWIPGGRITRFIWSWVEHGSSPIEVALGGVEKSLADEHSFILPKPPGISDLSRICLRIEGTQTMPDGREVAIAGGTTCEVSAPVFELALPPWWAPLALPVWTPNASDDVVLRDALAGHIGVQGAGTGREEPGAHALGVLPRLAFGTAARRARRRADTGPRRLSARSGGRPARGHVRPTTQGHRGQAAWRALSCARAPHGRRRGRLESDVWCGENAVGVRDQRPARVRVEARGRSGARRPRSRPVQAPGARAGSSAPPAAFGRQGGRPRARGGI